MGRATSGVKDRVIRYIEANPEARQVEVAQDCNCSTGYVSNIMEELGMSPRSRNSKRRSNSKLTQEDVDEIRRLHAGTDTVKGLSLGELQRRYPIVSKPMIHHIITGKKWRPLAEPKATGKITGPVADGTV